MCRHCGSADCVRVTSGWLVRGQILKVAAETMSDLVTPKDLLHQSWVGQELTSYHVFLSKPPGQDNLGAKLDINYSGSTGSHWDAALTVFATFSFVSLDWPMIPSPRGSPTGKAFLGPT